MFAVEYVASHLAALLWLISVCAVQTTYYSDNGCGPCYATLERRVSRLHHLLDTTSAHVRAVTRALSDRAVDSRFERHLSVVELNVQELARALQQLQRQEDRDFAHSQQKLQKRLHTTRQKLSQLSAALQECDKFSSYSLRVSSQIHEQLRRHNDTLVESWRYLSAEGVSTLAEASGHARKFAARRRETQLIGNQSLLLVDGQAARLALLSASVRSMDENQTQTYKFATDLVSVYRNFSKIMHYVKFGLQRLHIQKVEQKFLLETTNRLIDKYYNLMTKWDRANSTQSLGTRVRSTIAQLNRVHQTADHTSARVDTFSDQFTALLAAIDGKRMSADSLFRRFNTSQRELVKLQSTCQQLHTRMGKLLRKGEEILRVATNKRALLSNWSLEFESATIKRNEAFSRLQTQTKNLESIENVILASHKKAASVKQKLALFEKNRQHFRDEHKNIVSENGKIVKRVTAMRGKLQESKGFQSSFASNVEQCTVTSRLVSHQIQSLQNSSITIKERNVETNTIVLKLENQLRKIRPSLAAITEALSGDQEQADTQLEALGRKISASEHEIKRLNDDFQPDELNKLRVFLNTLTRSYEQEIIEMRKKVNIYEIISSSLPDGCHSALRLDN